MNQKSEQKFLNQIKQALDDSVKEGDDATDARLCQARQQAVQAFIIKQSKPVLWSYGLPSAVAASLIVAVLVATLWGGSGKLPSELEDLDLLVSNENLEMVENLDFYQWLIEQDNAG